MVYEGALAPPKGRIAIVVSRFNTHITGKLLEGAKKTLLAHGAGVDQIDIAWVPGAFELPAAAKRLAMGGAQAVICLGVVIRGDTPHFEYVAGGAAQGIMQLGLETQKPIIFGVLTVNTEEQALSRSNDDEGNKGSEAALTAIEMLHLFDKI